MCDSEQSTFQEYLLNNKLEMCGNDFWKLCGFEWHMCGFERRLVEISQYKFWKMSQFKTFLWQM